MRANSRHTFFCSSMPYTDTGVPLSVYSSVRRAASSFMASYSSSAISAAFFFSAYSFTKAFAFAGSDRSLGW